METLLVTDKTAAKPVEQEECYHCGDPCTAGEISLEDKSFCCDGCKLVYQILDENGLCNYYDLEDAPGIKLKSAPTDDQFSYLESADIQKQLLDFQSETFEKLTLYIPAIHCSSCIWLLENLYQLQPGVKQSRVNFVKKQLTVGYDPTEIGLRQLVEQLASLGYEPHISLHNGEEKKAYNPNRTLFIKIGVAGFCFGNIMLLSFPEYLGFDGPMDAEVRTFMSYLNVVFALPVIFYCSTDYFLSAWSGLRKGFINIDIPISIGILTLFLRSVYEIVSATAPGYLDSLGGLLFFLLIGKWFQQKTYEGLSFERDYKSYFPLGITRIANGVTEAISLRQIEVGDTLLIRNREIIPSDSVLLSSRASVDYSFVTGESEPVEKAKGAYLYAGGRLVGERIEVLVDKEVAQGYLTRLWNQDTFSKSDEGKWQSLVDQIARYFTAIILAIALATAIYWWVVDPSIMFTSFTAVLIVACPCALALATPFTLGTAMSSFGSRRFFLKNATIIEKLAGVTHIVFDKTGTITEAGHSAVQQVGTLDQKGMELVYALVSQSTHPLSRKLFSHFTLQKGLALQKIEEFEEIEGKGLQGKVDSTSGMIGSASFTGWQDATDQLNGASRVYYVIGDQHGYFEIINDFREGLDELIGMLKGNYGLSLISGDHAAEEDRLKSKFPAGTTMQFEQSPQDKLAYVRSLQERGAKVLMVGDGLNDAGALKQSEVGIALTENISSFSPACDGILEAARFSHLAAFMDFAKSSKGIIIASFVISFLYNIVGLSLAVTGLLEPVYAAILMPVSSITVVAFATLSIHLLTRIKKL
ncbi:MAG: heavy metal translocating P-type ATPase metal-binding domain-containing protein [Cyclobacteriaceae bacterium]